MIRNFNQCVINQYLISQTSMVEAMLTGNL